MARTTLGLLNGMLSEDSPVRDDLSNALRALASAARSVRDLASYLERHPEALLKGKR